ncbi:hypothetical protein ACQY0O_004955 [Thecaphora frezii]
MQLHHTRNKESDNQPSQPKDYGERRSAEPPFDPDPRCVDFLMAESSDVPSQRLRAALLIEYSVWSTVGRTPPPRSVPDVPGGSVLGSSALLAFLPVIGLAAPGWQG